MFRRIVCVLTVCAGAASPAFADQKLSFSLGYFAVRGEDARVTDDVLVENRNFLAFDIDDFNGGTVGAEWLFDIGDYVEAGVGVGYYKRTVPTVYVDFVHSDGSEIEQDMKLRITPITALVRVFPMGQHRGFQPYIGGGVGLFNWRYSESGEFIDSAGDIFRERFVADGNNAGPVILAGLRFANASQFGVGGEFRYQAAEGDVGHNFLADKIDLGGYSTTFTVLIRF